MGLLSEYELQQFLKEVDDIRKENKTLDPNLYSDFIKIQKNIDRLQEIKEMANRFLIKKKRAHLKLIK